MCLVTLRNLHEIVLFYKPTKLGGVMDLAHNPALCKTIQKYWNVWSASRNLGNLDQITRKSPFEYSDWSHLYALELYLISGYTI